MSKKRAELRRQRRAVEHPWTPFEPASYEGSALPGRSLLADAAVINSRYQVGIRALPNGWHHLSIHRRDREPCRDWRDFQRIKNELCGPEREAIELYPAESRLVDTANEYHLWVAPEGVRLEMGFRERLVSEETLGRSRQRPFESPPPDLASAQDMLRMLDDL